MPKREAPAKSGNLNRSHRLDKQTTNKPRTITTKRHCLQTNRKPKVVNIEENPTIFINEDLTNRRSAVAFETRKLKKSGKIADCWTVNGNVLLEDLTNSVRQVRSQVDLQKYL